MSDTDFPAALAIVRREIEDGRNGPMMQAGLADLEEAYAELKAERDHYKRALDWISLTDVGNASKRLAGMSWPYNGAELVRQALTATAEPEPAETEEPSDNE